jgi:hypothetical protein
MNLYNNTPMEAYYEVSYGNGFNCGTIPAQQNLANPAWDNQPTVKVVFSSMEGTPPSNGNPFSVNIPNTGTGMSVTIGLYQE